MGFIGSLLHIRQTHCDVVLGPWSTLPTRRTHPGDPGSLPTRRRLTRVSSSIRWARRVTRSVRIAAEGPACIHRRAVMPSKAGGKETSTGAVTALARPPCPMAVDQPPSNATASLRMLHAQLRPPAVATNMTNPASAGCRIAALLCSMPGLQRAGRRSAQRHTNGTTAQRRLKAHPVSVRMPTRTA